MGLGDDPSTWIYSGRRTYRTEDQVAQEIAGCISIVKIIFEKLGMDDYRVRVGLRDPDSSKYVGEPERWDRAEKACRDAAEGLGVPFTEESGEAAFYGPKIDFVVKDVLGREWQLGTVQVDYNLPERFDLTYIGADGESHRPVMIHRAPFGSLERFVGVLIEHFGGAFPTWLSPVQVRVVTVSEKVEGYAKTVVDRLRRSRSALSSTRRPRPWARRSVGPSRRRCRTFWWSASEKRRRAP